MGASNFEFFFPNESLERNVDEAHSMVTNHKIAAKPTGRHHQDIRRNPDGVDWVLSQNVHGRRSLGAMACQNSIPETHISHHLPQGTATTNITVSVHHDNEPLPSCDMATEFKAEISQEGIMGAYLLFQECLPMRSEIAPLLHIHHQQTLGLYGAVCCVAPCHNTVLALEKLPDPAAEVCFSLPME